MEVVRFVWGLVIGGMVGALLGLLIVFVLTERSHRRWERENKAAQLRREIAGEVGEPVVVILPDGRRR